MGILASSFQKSFEGNSVEAETTEQSQGNLLDLECVRFLSHLFWGHLVWPK